MILPDRKLKQTHVLATAAIVCALCSQMRLQLETNSDECHCVRVAVEAGASSDLGLSMVWLFHVEVGGQL